MSEKVRVDVHRWLFRPEILAFIGMSKRNTGQGIAESRAETNKRGDKLAEMLYDEPPEGGAGEAEDTAIDV